VTTIEHQEEADMADNETTATEDPSPTSEEITSATELLASLPETDRRAIATALAPPEPGTPGNPLTREQARELIQTNPEKFHALLDAQLAGGPYVIDLEN